MGSKENGVPEVKPDNWPSKLIMQLIPKSLVQTIGGQYFRNSKSVLFHPNDCESLEALTKVMGTGFAGCVHFTGSCDIKVLILLYSNDKKAYLGFLPNDQVSFVDRIRTVIQQQKMGQQQQQLQQQQQPGGAQRIVNMGPGGQMVQQGPQPVMNMMPSGQQVGQQQVTMGMMTSQQQQQQNMSQSVMMNSQQQQLQQQQQQGMMGQQQQQQVMGQQQRMMMGPSGGMVGQQQIIRGQQVMGQQPQYVRMSGGQGMP